MLALFSVVFSVSLASAQDVPRSEEEAAELVRRLLDRIDQLEARLPPAGAVIAFEKDSCPTELGWVEYKPAQGRFVRGIDLTGRNIDPDGRRAPGDTKQDAFQKHQIGDGQGHYLRYADAPNRPEYSVLTNGSLGTTVTGIFGANRQFENAYNTRLKNAELVGVGAEGGGAPRMSTETRPKSVALLYCIKQ